MAISSSFGSRGFKPSAPLQGALYMTVAAFFFSIMNYLVRLAGQELDPIQVAFFRNFFALLFMLPWLLRVGRAGLATNRLGGHIWRALLGMGAMFCWFYAVTLLPLAEAVSLNFTVPLFATVGAALILGEVVRARRWTATAVGFLGVLVILRPGFTEVTWVTGLPILAAAFMAGATLFVKSLSETEAPNTIVLYMNLLLTPLSLVPALFVWQWPSATTLFYVAVLGMLAAAAHIPRLCRGRRLGHPAVRLHAPAVRRGHRLPRLRRGAGPLDLDRRRHHCQLGDLHRPPRDADRPQRGREPARDQTGGLADAGRPLKPPAVEARRARRSGGAAGAVLRAGTVCLPGGLSACRADGGARAVAVARLDVRLDAADGDRQDRGVVGEAHPGDEVGDHVGGHDEIGERPHEDRLNLHRRLAVHRAVVGGDRFLEERHAPQGAAHLGPEAVLDPRFVPLVAPRVGRELR
jgi:drug/metabolite transporter (DMT)-like permease